MWRGTPGEIKLARVLKHVNVMLKERTCCFAHKLYITRRSIRHATQSGLCLGFKAQCGRFLQALILPTNRWSQYGQRGGAKWNIHTETHPRGLKPPPRAPASTNVTATPRMLHAPLWFPSFHLELLALFFRKSCEGCDTVRVLIQLLWAFCRSDWRFWRCLFLC